jgi:hypothetical protein
LPGAGKAGASNCYESMGWRRRRLDALPADSVLPRVSQRLLRRHIAAGLLRLEPLLLKLDAPTIRIEDVILVQWSSLGSW